MPVCAVCGDNGGLICGSCLKVTYCSREHQLGDTSTHGCYRRADGVSKFSAVESVAQAINILSLSAAPDKDVFTQTPTALIRMAVDYIAKSKSFPTAEVGALMRAEAVYKMPPEDFKRLWRAWGAATVDIEPVAVKRRLIWLAFNKWAHPDNDVLVDYARARKPDGWTSNLILLVNLCPTVVMGPSDYEFMLGDIPYHDDPAAISVHASADRRFLDHCLRRPRHPAAGPDEPRALANPSEQHTPAIRSSRRGQHCHGGVAGGIV